MLEAADYCLVMAYPESATGSSAGIMLLVPRIAEGRTVDANWDTLGMRATRSDSLILEECRLPDSAVIFQSDDIGPFRHAHANWFGARIRRFIWALPPQPMTRYAKCCMRGSRRATHNHWPIIPMSAAMLQR
jgi:hypothetical protein